MRVPKREVYNYKRADWTAINADLIAIDWETELDKENIQESWYCFKNILFKLMDQHIINI